MCWDAACRIWTPEFWTSRSTVIFNFTGFLDYDSGIPRYEWGLGSQQGRVDVVPWMEMTANRVLKDVRYNGGTQKMMVTYVVSGFGPAPACKIPDCSAIVILHSQSHAAGSVCAARCGVLQDCCLARHARAGSNSVHVSSGGLAACSWV